MTGSQECQEEYDKYNLCNPIRSTINATSLVDEDQVLTTKFDDTRQIKLRKALDFLPSYWLKNGI